ncbi:MAG TPA: tetratricopeptide repeat protein [Candidatus Binatia bacterium]|nr:tetratricopeptide repeat protein [Candidatus Binatia bacterium]
MVPHEPTALIRDTRRALEVAQRDFERGHLRETIEVLERVVAGGGGTVAVHTMLGVAHARTRQVDRAFDHLERAIALDPDAFGPRCALGELYLRLCVVEQGRAHLRHALELASTPEERRCVQALLREDRERDKRRAYRPHFWKPFFGGRKR